MIAFRVLVVDNDEDDRSFLREALEEVGIEPILTLESAQEVFSYLQKIKEDKDLPKLIITDLNMPGISGYELLQALQTMNRYKHIPVIVCSTSSASFDVSKCITAGAKEFIKKPNTIYEYGKITDQMKQYVLD